MVYTITEETERPRKEFTSVAVRLGDFEIKIEGKHENVKTLMGEPLYDFIRGLQSVSEELPEVTTSTTVTTTTDETPITEYPPPLGKPRTLADALRNLMISSEWGSRPRQLNEIMTAMETSGIYYSSGQVSRRLLDLVRQNELRRLGTRGNYRYVAA